MGLSWDRSLFKDWGCWVWWDSRMVRVWIVYFGYIFFRVSDVFMVWRFWFIRGDVDLVILG